MNARRYQIRWVGVLIIGLFMLGACSADPVVSSMPDARDMPPSDAGEQAPVDAGSQNGVDSGPVADAGADPSPVQSGYNSLFIGHSFFIPVARGMIAHAERAGIEGHRQQTIFSGGGTGAPQALWNNANKSAQIKAILDQGDIELFGMTYHPNHPGLSGYTNWIDYALERNSDLTVFIGLPWQPQPAAYDSETYMNAWEVGHPSIAHGHIDALRERYPNLTIFCIPYGEGAAVLHQLQSSGELPDVDAIQSSAGNRGIFRDRLGHGEPILIQLSQLVWLRAIYGVDLVAYDHDPGYSADLKTIATEIMSGHQTEYSLQP